MRTFIALAAVLTLMACNDGGDVVATDNRAAPETGATAQVARLDEGQRNGVFQKAIRASGGVCPSVTTSERIEVRHGVNGWKAQCDDGSAHLIEILPDGTAEVTSRRD